MNSSKCFQLTRNFLLPQVYADGYSPRELEVMVIESHPTLVNVTLHPSKVKILLETITDNINLSSGKAVVVEMTESKPPYNYYAPSHMALSDDPQLMTVSDKVSYFTRDDHNLLTSFWGVKSSSNAHFCFTCMPFALLIIFCLSSTNMINLH